MPRNRILVVEDEQSMQELYHAFFAQAHKDEFGWNLAKDGEEALKLLERDRPDIVVLDWKLPRMSGLDVLRRIRSDPASRHLLVFVVTGLARPQDCVLALESGADDYLQKPFESQVLLARLHSLARRGQNAVALPSRSVEIDGLRLDAEKDEVTVDGRDVDLHPKEMDLLKVFLRRPDMIHATQDLWDLLWYYPSKNCQHTLSQTISSLKKKLGPKWAERLEFRTGKGYILRPPG